MRIEGHRIGGLIHIRLKKNGKWGLIDNIGNEIIKCKYKDLFPFVNGISLLTKDEKWGAIDSNFNKILTEIFDTLILSEEYNDYIKA